MAPKKPPKKDRKVPGKAPKTVLRVWTKTKTPKAPPSSESESGDTASPPHSPMPDWVANIGASDEEVPSPTPTGQQGPSPYPSQEPDTLGKVSTGINVLLGNVVFLFYSISQ